MCIHSGLLNLISYMVHIDRSVYIYVTVNDKMRREPVEKCCADRSNYLFLNDGALSNYDKNDFTVHEILCRRNNKCNRFLKLNSIRLNNLIMRWRQLCEYTGVYICSV